jgi:hypothetical protein
VKIWIIRHNPKREPKFHQNEIFEGVGRVIKEEEKIFNKTFFLKIFIMSYLIARNGPYIIFVNIATIKREISK